jgi:hypothetical protein
VIDRHRQRPWSGRKTSVQIEKLRMHRMVAGGFKVLVEG